MAQWQTADAKQRFGELVEAAKGQGPQLVMRHQDLVVVVLAPDDYRQLVRQADANFGRVLTECPFGPDDNEPVGISLATGA